MSGTERVVAGRYRLLTQLGRGGMGTVWRAEDELLGRQVAVKEVHLRAGLSDEERQEQRDRTLREARAVARIAHGSVVGVFDVVEEDGRPWIVMELVDGGSLAARIAAEGPLPPAECARLGLAVLDALSAAHELGILHRDVKPANVLWERAKDRWVLTDFGIAQVDGAATLTEVGAFLGSPEFTAPERLHGDRAGLASDLWSVGALLVAALDGRSLFQRTSVTAVLHAVAYGEITLPERARPLAHVVLPLLERDPEKRPDPALVRAQLAGFLRGGPGSTVPLPPPPSRRRSPAVLAGGALFVVAAAVAGGLAMNAWLGASHATASPSASGGTPASAGASATTAASVTAPAGFGPVRDPRGFTLAVPTGWDRSVDSTDGSRVYYNSPFAPGQPEGLYRVGIRVQDGVSTVPPQAQVCPGPKGYPGYRANGPTSLLLHGGIVAICSFTWNGAGGPARVSDLALWTSRGRTYTLWASGPKEQAQRVLQIADVAEQTFSPGR
ncbi:serine/threonine-protein kinase [Streptacidiphilus rugosus]|uniref:serine/threonine-protein kinase n=1 Tax=Streptacidiphilus rugosus TaxID=405783 RepID=UPI00068E131B|nr:serine/threonine-protein kinase [Streptacidiphilus rugosus]